MVALMSDQTPVLQARDSVDEHPIFGAIAYGDQKAKAPTQLSRTAVMAARKILNRNRYRKRNINNLARDAEVWAAVWVTYSGSLDAAWQGEYQTWKKPGHGPGRHVGTGPPRISQQVAITKGHYLRVGKPELSGPSP